MVNGTRDIVRSLRSGPLTRLYSRAVLKRKGTYLRSSVADPDPYQIEKQDTDPDSYQQDTDPDSYQSEKQDPDPDQMV